MYECLIQILNDLAVGGLQPVLGLYYGHPVVLSEESLVGSAYLA